MRKIENNKGITLAVLVITIVVLLILAGITIANITGGYGILGQAQSKKDAATIQKEKTILGNAVMTASNKTKLGDLTEENLRNALSNKNVDIVKSGKLYKITFKDTNNLYKMNENGEYFYWENMVPQTFYAKLYSDGTLIFSSNANTTYRDCYPNAETDLEPVETQTNSFGYTKANVKKVIFHNPIAPTTCAQMFYNCVNLQEIENIEYLHTENANSMYFMFFGCSKLKSVNLKYFDTKNVKNMSYMFYACESLERLDFNSFDTSNVSDLQVMFYYCINLKELDLSHFDLSNVTSLVSMFNYCKNLQKINLSNWNTSKVTTMKSMFLNCHNIKILDLSSFDTSNVTNMYYMFGECINLKTIYVSNKFVTNKVAVETTQNVDDGKYVFLRNNNIVGGAGTKYNSSKHGVTYAHIDGGTSNPGYFTLKQ